MGPFKLQWNGGQAPRCGLQVVHWDGAEAAERGEEGIRGWLFLDGARGGAGWGGGRYRSEMVGKAG